MQLHNISLTTWDKPWIPELDWINFHINRSVFNQIALDGLAVGYKVSKYTKYMASSKWGCFLSFQWDAELAEAYYFEHYNNTNETMLLISPYIPMRPESFKNWSNHFSPFRMISWMHYRPGLLKEFYQAGDIGYIWRTSGLRLRVALVVTLIITLTGVFGKYDLCGILTLHKLRLSRDRRQITAHMYTQKVYIHV